MRYVPLLAAAMSAIAGGAFAQGGACQLSQTDTAYLQSDAQGAAYELAMGQLATQKAVDPHVKQYAAMIVQDHEKFNSALQQLAQECGVTLPTTLTTAQQAQLDRLKGASGNLFDSTFITDARAINVGDAQDSQKEASATQSPKIKAFIEQFKSVDQKHTQDAEALNAEGAYHG